MQLTMDMMGSLSISDALLTALDISVIFIIKLDTEMDTKVQNWRDLN